jgi:hypothetical protein
MRRRYEIRHLEDGVEAGRPHADAFAVDDIVGTLRELRSKGVVFEEYDYPGLKTVDGISDAGDLKAAWSRDSEGNMISLMQPIGGSVLEFAAGAKAT